MTHVKPVPANVSRFVVFQESRKTYGEVRSSWSQPAMRTIRARKVLRLTKCGGSHLGSVDIRGLKLD